MRLFTFRDPPTAPDIPALQNARRGLRVALVRTLAFKIAVVIALSFALHGFVARRRIDTATLFQPATAIQSR